MLKDNLRKYHNTSCERCGVITEEGTIVELDNLHPDPINFFRMDITNHSGVVATWHTHTGSNFNLSIEDYRTFMAHPDLCHYIVSAFEVQCYRTVNGTLVSDNDYNPLIRSFD